MRISNAFATAQFEEFLRHVAARVHLFDSENRGDVGKAPRVHVEHRRHRHVHVAVTE